MGEHVWFNGWGSLLRVAIYAVVSYVLVIALVRVLGKRTISKMNPSDFVITVAVGSLVANWVLQQEVSLVDGVVGVAIFLLLQHANEYATARSQHAQKLAEGEPVLLAFDGHLLHDNLERENVSEREVHSALRQNGLGRIEEASAVVLEIDGTFTVLPRHEHAPVIPYGVKH